MHLWDLWETRYIHTAKDKHEVSDFNEIREDLLL